MSGLVDQSADARSKTIGANFRCRAWVNFNGTGTVAIQESANVSSITDHGTGDYQVNLSTPMPDANYAAAHQVGDSSAYQGRMNYALTVTSSSYRFKGAMNTASNLQDTSICMVAFFR